MLSNARNIPASLSTVRVHEQGPLVQQEGRQEMGQRSSR